MDLLPTLLTCFTDYGYVAVFTVLLVCGFGIPIPEDLSLVAGGVIAGMGFGDPALMVVTGLAGVLAGDAFIFMLGRTYGHKLLACAPVARLINPVRRAIVEEKFHRYGNRLMFIARFLPGMRTAIFLSAGMCRRVSPLRFILSDGFAALLSVPIWVCLGYLGAQNRHWLMMWVHRGQMGIVVLVGCLALVAVTVWFFKRRHARTLI